MTASDLDHQTQPMGLVRSGDAAEAAAALALAHELGRELHEAPTLRSAMAIAASRLGAFLVADGHTLIRVQGWNGSTCLVRPWQAGADGAGEWIDLSLLTLVRSDERPLGTAIATLRAARLLGDATACDEAQPGCAWRPAGASAVLAVPILASDEPVAAIELYGVIDDTLAVRQLIDLVAMQLSAVAQREANTASAASVAEQATRLALVASRLAGGVAITDRQGAVEWVNPTFTEVTGLASKEVLGKPLALALNLRDEGSAHALAQQFSRAGTFRQQFDARRAGAAGAYRCEVDALLMVQEPAELSQFVCVVSDVSANHRAAQELQESQQRYKELIESMEDGVFVATPGCEQFLYASERLLDIWGLNADDLAGGDAALRARLDAADLALHDAQRQRELRFEPTDVTYRIRHGGRGVRWVRTRTRTPRCPTANCACTA
jgi:PAS domain S-box-containing protein